jgi:hypothetical protein
VNELAYINNQTKGLVIYFLRNASRVGAQRFIVTAKIITILATAKNVSTGFFTNNVPETRISPDPF